MGLAVFGLAIYRAHPSAVLAELARLRFGAVWLLVPYALGTTVGALPWAELLPTSARPGLGAVVAGRFVASSANAMLPFFGLAGEPLRLLWLEPRARPPGLAAIVVDRALYNAANGVLLLAGATVALRATTLSSSLSLLVLLAGWLTLGVTVVALVLVVRLGIGARLQRLLARLLGAVYTGESGGARVDAALLALLRHGRGTLALGLALHVLGRALILVEVVVGLRLLDAPATLAQSVVLAVVPVALSLVFSSVPSQIGIQEGGQALAAAALGLSPALGVTLVLMQRFRQLVFALCVPLLLRFRAPPHHSAGSSSGWRENTKSR